MPNPHRRPARLRAVSPPLRRFVPVLLLCLFSLAAGSAIAQSSPTPPNALEKQLNRIDLSISAAGLFSTSVAGTNYTGVTFTQRPSNTVGELGTIRYVAKPYVGFEFNFGNSRYAQNFVTTAYKSSSVCPNSSCTYLPGGAQNNVHEETLGYIAHPPHSFFGLDPFLGAGGGTMQFRPTPGGGQGLPRQYRAVYYYTAGVDDYFPSTHFGIRVGFRQLIYLAPDFGQNYLTITRRARTTEPTFGFFLRF
jgi:hypothetical protein